MLTEIYYYNYYRPYIFKSKKIAKTPGAAVINTKNDADNAFFGLDKDFSLNRAFKSSIVDYAKGVSGKVNSFKETVSALKSDSNLQLPYSKVDKILVKDSVIEDLSAFTETVNDTVSFARNQSHSSDLQNFGVNVLDIMNAYDYLLAELSIDINQNVLTFDEKAAKGCRLKELLNCLNEFNSGLGLLYSETMEVMSKPLSSHMHFKSLGYYYNYKYGSILDNTFNIIDSGMIYDKAL